MDEDRVQALLDSLNAHIATMTRYGSYKMVAPKRGYRLIWSNARRRWYIGGDSHAKGATIYMDANVIFTTARLKDLKLVVDRLDPLPLYSNSFESVWLGKK